MKHHTRFVAFAAVGLLLVLWGVVSAAGAIESSRAPDVPTDVSVVSVVPPATTDGIEFQWTAEARQSARPHTSGGAMPVGVTSLPRSSEPEQTSDPGFSPGGMPQPGADAEAQALFPEEWVALADDAAVAGEESKAQVEEVNLSGTGVYSAFYANKYQPMWKRYPFNAIGKLFFNTPSGPAYCTATVIGENLIVTSAQCIFDTATNTGFTDITFCPAARGAGCPYGLYPWTKADLQSPYMDAATWGEAIRYDLALVYLAANSAGRGVHTYTGWLGQAWNASPSQHVFAFGYPDTKEGNDFSLICAGETFSAGEGIVEMGCDSGFGQLGGPWIVNFAPYEAGAFNYVNGITSYQYTRGRNAMGSAPSLLRRIADSCEEPDC